MGNPQGLRKPPGTGIVNFVTIGGGDEGRNQPHSAASVIATATTASPAFKGFQVQLARAGTALWAVRTLEEVLPRLPGFPVDLRFEVHGILRYEMGRLLLDLARPREAERYFRSLVNNVSVLGAPVEYYLGQTYEALGDREKAKFHYGRFVRWWEDCDPELRPWREQGREALARLTSEPVSN